MTISKLIEWANHHPIHVSTYMILIPVLALIATLSIGRINRRSPLRYIYSVIMYATCVPGVLAIVLCCYTVGLQRLDILKVNILAYFLPIASMAVTIKIIGRKTRMTDIPGFKRLSGFMLMIGATFVIVFILQRLFIGVIFFGTLQSLFLLFIVLYVSIKIAWDRLAG